jgi:hypothetical protein
MALVLALVSAACLALYVQLGTAIRQLDEAQALGRVHGH